MIRTVAIVGAGLAGAKAAEALRTEGYDGRVVLIGEEPERPYERPPLSKGVLRGDDAESTAYVHAEGFADDQQIDVLTGTRVEALDVTDRRLTVAGGRAITFDRLLLATGSEPRRLPIPGADLDGVHVLRTLADARRLRAAIEHGSRVAVIGAGWIGCEVAASARQMGRDVVMVDPLPTPLCRVLGEQVGAVFGAMHAEHGVDLRLGVGVAALHGGPAVEAVSLADGSRVEADVVVLGVGVTPRVELAKAAGLLVGDGVIADEHLETSAAGIYVAGDVAEATHPLLHTRVRVEHWANALNQGPAAARNMLGARRPYDRLPYFYSDQYDLSMEYVGFTRQWDSVVFRGDVTGREFVAFYLVEGRVVAGIAVNVHDAIEPLKALITRGAVVAAKDLADDTLALERLAEPTAA